MRLEPSELILNADGSVYHLNLLPEDIADTVVLVGDPERVPQVSRYFDRVRLRKTKREFATHTGTLRGREITVLSTGIGTDNIDIVLNELDALANIDLQTRLPREKLRTLDLVRIGTCGAIQADIPVDTLIASDRAAGFDGLLHYYRSESIQQADIQIALLEQLRWPVMQAVPYVVSADASWTDRFRTPDMPAGLTATNPGFYAPQGRRLRLEAHSPGLLQSLSDFRLGDIRITHLEMETAGILGMSALLGHRAASISAVLANRITQAFSPDPQATVDRLIRQILDRIF